VFEGGLGIYIVIKKFILTVNIWEYFMKLLLIIFLFPVAIFSQTGIKGKVLDKNNKGILVGANVFLVGTKFGSATDKDGKYKLNNIIPGKYILRCTYIGYKPEEKEINIKKDNVLAVDFTLKELEVKINKNLISTYIKKSRIKTIPIPPATFLISQAELLPLTKPGDLVMKLLNKNSKKIKN
jgi:CarboxypepD_reg-like domain